LRQTGLGPVTLAHGHRENHKLKRWGGCVTRHQKGIASSSQNAGAPTPRAGRAAAAAAGDASAACGFRVHVCVAGLPHPTQCLRLLQLWGPRKRSAAPHSGGGGGPVLVLALALVGTALPDASTHRAGGGAGQARAGALLVPFLPSVYWFEAPGRALWVE